ncbi:MAG: zinc ABC transporter substrate-binding protein [Bacteroidales bacterium]
MKQIIKRIQRAYLLYLLFTVLIAITFGCQNPNTKQDKKVVSVSILPQKYFVEQIAGDHFEINVLIPPGASPASYDPSPKQIKDLETSSLYLKIGYIEFEKNWLEKFTKNYPNLKVFDTSTGVKLLEDKHDHHHHSGWVEPHIWMSPKNVKVIAQNIYDALVLMEPESIQVFQENLQSFLKNLDQIDAQISAKLKNLKSNTFIIYHPALTYYAHNYGLKQVSIEIDGKNPSARHIKEIIDLAKKENIKLVFVQQQFDQTKATGIAKEIKGEVVPIDPLSYNWKSQISMITNELALYLNK